MYELADSLNVMASNLKNLGVGISMRAFLRDSRYVEMHEDLDELEFWLSAVVQKFGKGEVWTGQPDLSQLFEFFCYSQIIQAFEAEGFVVSERGSDLPVHYFVRLQNPSSKIRATILYDQEIVGADEINENDYAPIVCSLKNRPANGWFRPDFTIIFEKDGYSGFVFLDSKYQSHQKARKAVSALATKYLTNLVGNLKDGKPCMYIGVMCLPDSNEKPESKSQMSEELSIGGNMEPYFSHGYHLMSAKNNALSSLIPNLINKFEGLLEQKILDRTEQNGVPVRRVPEPRNLIVKAKQNFIREKGYSRYTKHFAPTVTNEMAAKIKGMLLRGDKPQDIALYFGINGGRVSEIKSGEKFSTVQPETYNNLPPEGPYPPLSNFI
ncbi:hypothetical protein RS24_00761 [Candidatus Micropelagos thuwalensis]|uniref:Uncharacterized protein n=1 Tax=Candidatus Micropelagius thuwalensis TaxID=1397666 RepID=U2XY05_9PROT|nr:hypothetical protein [Candidatus Micropelagos thuwalensis]ERL47781.1 hypothetical protein RS24_00761 [Candidatus Micropelagos thuwalensis]